MNTLPVFSTALLLGAAVAPQPARADTADANCEVRKDGDQLNLPPNQRVKIW